MFKYRSPKRLFWQDIYVRPLLPAVLVFLAFMVTIGISWRTARLDIDNQQKNVVDQSSSFVESALVQRFYIYEDSLRAANGLFLSSDSVTRTEWSEFVSSLDLSNRYPGIRGLGFIKIVPAASKDSFEASVRADGVSNYTVYPASQNAMLAPLQLIVPLGGSSTDDNSSPVLGFDMYSEPARVIAMKHAAESGEPALSSIVKLLPTSDKPAGRGFLMFMPLYKKGMPHSTVAERTSAIDGYFYAPFVSDGVFTSLFTLSNPSFAFTIYDGAEEPANRLYESNQAIDDPSFTKVKSSSVSLFGKDWNIVYKIKPDIVPYSVRSRPLNVVVAGSLFSVGLALIIYLLIQRRTRALAYSEQKKLEEAKDELLSLASHQLRTPATAVKQYVSMVKEGFAGEITQEQRKLLQMAYESNERQLGIVDELLYVARVDAGKTTLRMEPVDISEFITSVITDQQITTKARQQKVVFSRPQKTIIVDADPMYLRMIVENLLTNASKYSYQKTKITVSVHKGQEYISIDVIDNGVGIKQSDYKNVFVKFSRIHNELTRQTPGSGIGLYLSKQLALLHGGDLTFVSRPHRGTTFTLILPRNRQGQKL